MAHKKFWFGMLIVMLSLALMGCGTIDLNNLVLGEEDTSIYWSMEKTSAPPLETLTKLSNTSREAAAIYRFADRAEAKENIWYVFTSAEKPGEIYYAYKNWPAGSNTWKWEVYK